MPSAKAKHPTDLIRQIQKGLRFSELETFAKTASTCRSSSWQQKLSISRSTLQRRKAAGRLSADESDKVMRLRGCSSMPRMFLATSKRREPVEVSTARPWWRRPARLCRNGGRRAEVDICWGASITALFVKPDGLAWRIVRAAARRRHLAEKARGDTEALEFTGVRVVYVSEHQIHGCAGGLRQSGAFISR